MSTRMMERLGLVVWLLDLPGPLVLDIAVALQARLLPVPVFGRHPAQPTLFALAKLFTGGLRPAQLLGAHPLIPRLPHLTLPGALVGTDDGDDDYDRDKDPHLV